MVKGKFVAALLPFAYAVAAVFVPFFADGKRPDSVGWVQIAIGVVTAVSVYVVPLTAKHPAVKTAVGAMLAGLGVLVTAIVGGVNGAEALEIAAYVLAALGIAVAPAESDTGVAVGWGSDDPIRTPLI